MLYCVDLQGTVNALCLVQSEKVRFYKINPGEEQSCQYLINVLCFAEGENDVCVLFLTSQVWCQGCEGLELTSQA